MDSKKYQVNEVNAWNGWDPLKQVVLGNSFAPEIFENIGDHKLRDLLQQILYETYEDLMGIKKIKNYFRLKINVKNKIFYFDTKYSTNNFINNILACISTVFALNLNLNKMKKKLEYLDLINLAHN